MPSQFIKKKDTKEIHMYVFGSPNFIQGSAPDPPGAGWAEGNMRGKTIHFIVSGGKKIHRLRYVEDGRGRREFMLCNNL